MENLNEPKPEDVMKSCDRAQPSDERSALREYRRRIYEAVNYRGDCDHEDVTTILLEYKKALIREKDAEIGRLNKAMDVMVVEHKRLMETAKAEIERLNTELKAMRGAANSMKMHYENARAEAITDFAERLKRFYRNLGGKTVGGSVEYHIEQIEKELKEDLNAT